MHHGKFIAMVAAFVAAAGFGLGALAQPASGKGSLKGGSEYEKRLEQSGMSGMSGMSGDHSSTAAAAKPADPKAGKQPAKVAKKKPAAEKKAAN